MKAIDIETVGRGYLWVMVLIHDTSWFLSRYGFTKLQNFRVENHVVIASILNVWKIAKITHGSHIFHEATEAAGICC